MKHLGILSVILLSLTFLSTNAFSQTHPDSMKQKKHKMEMKDHSKHKMDNDHMKHKKSSIVREGVIDLVKIDKNKDGKVFQDMMDWNVISDKAGKCTLCGMKLKEVTLKQAKKNLLKYGHKVK